MHTASQAHRDKPIIGWASYSTSGTIIRPVIQSAHRGLPADEQPSSRLHPSPWAAKLAMGLQQIAMAVHVAGTPTRVRAVCPPTRGQNPAYASAFPRWGRALLVAIQSLPRAPSEGHPVRHHRRQTTGVGVAIADPDSCQQPSSYRQHMMMRQPRTDLRLVDVLRALPRTLRLDGGVRLHDSCFRGMTRCRLPAPRR